MLMYQKFKIVQQKLKALFNPLTQMSTKNVDFMTFLIITHDIGVEK